MVRQKGQFVGPGAEARDADRDRAVVWDRAAEVRHARERQMAKPRPCLKNGSNRFSGVRSARPI